MKRGFHDHAQICPNGHLATTEFLLRQEERKSFCDQCGERTLTTCPGCREHIRGRFQSSTPSSTDSTSYRIPAFCRHCGKAFPWTERKQAAAIELFGAEIQEEEERKEFTESVEQIVKDTPQAQVASNRLVRLLKKVTVGTANTIRDILVDVASEAVKKTILP